MSSQGPDLLPRITLGAADDTERLDLFFDKSEPIDPPPAADSVYKLWTAALRDYSDSLAIDPLNENVLPFKVDLRPDSSSEDVVAILRTVSKSVEKKRRGCLPRRSLEGVATLVVDGLRKALDICKEVCSAVVPGGQALFIAIAILLDAGERFHASLKDLQKLFERFVVYMQRLEVRSQVDMGDGQKQIAVKVLVDLLKAFQLSTKVLRRHSLVLFLKALVTDSSDARSVLQDLEETIADENSMIITDVFVGMHRLDQGVLRIQTSMDKLFKTLEQDRQQTMATLLTLNDKVTTILQIVSRPTTPRPETSSHAAIESSSAAATLPDSSEFTIKEQQLDGSLSVSKKLDTPIAWGVDVYVVHRMIADGQHRLTHISQVWASLRSMR
ncbi:hypothetical protein PENSPDRAFT_188551 [Peniophora sp. CONT]|nr:hypothetical protein PENSPDRAFT_188551 [Peniophora sp. CONT]